MKRNLNNIAALLLLLVAVSACSKKEAPPPPAQKPAPKPAAKPAAPVQKQVSSATVAGPPRTDFSKKTDPFRPYAPPAAPAPTAEAGRKPGADVLPIQSFETNRFRVAGIIAGLNENRALVIDPSGKGYVVSEGMQIGSNEGRITRITASSVEVVERYKEDNGRIRKRKVVLPLAKKR